MHWVTSQMRQSLQSLALVSRNRQDSQVGRRNPVTRGPLNPQSSRNSIAVAVEFYIQNKHILNASLFRCGEQATATIENSHSRYVQATLFKIYNNVGSSNQCWERFRSNCVIFPNFSVRIELGTCSLPATAAEAKVQYQLVIFFPNPPTQ